MPGVGGDHRRGAREPPPADALRGRGPRCAGSWESEFGAAAALRAGRGTARATDLRWLNEAAPDAPRSSRQERTPVRKGRNRLRLAPGAEAAAGERRRAGRAPRRSACGPADGFLSKPIFRGVRASQLCDSFLRPRIQRDTGASLKISRWLLYSTPKSFNGPGDYFDIECFWLTAFKSLGIS
eukprot:XP_022266874.1 uncharacterized protein LOC106557897 isoform X2 [Canis lupus familiaris]